MNTNYPRNLLESVFGTDNILDVPDDIQQAVDFVLKQLTEREQAVINYRYVLGLSLSQIGKQAEFRVTTERVRQILYKAERKMRSPKYAEYLRYGVAGAEKLKAERESQKADELKIFYCRNAYTETTLDNLDLSARSYNALSRAGCKTIGDVIEIGYENLCRIRNLGRNSIREIEEKVFSVSPNITNRQYIERMSNKHFAIFMFNFFTDHSRFESPADFETWLASPSDFNAVLIKE